MASHEPLELSTATGAICIVLVATLYAADHALVDHVQSPFSTFDGTTVIREDSLASMKSSS